MKQFYLSLFFITLLISGCTEKTTALRYFKADETTTNSIQYTKKRDFLLNNEVKVMFFATYLNKIDKKYYSETEEKFLFGIHVINNDNKFKLTGDELFLNENKAIEIIKLRKENKLINKLTLKDKWATYYLITFKKEENKTLKLSFTYSDLGEKVVTFQK